MDVDVEVPDCPLAEGCFAFIEDWVNDDLQRPVRRHIVALAAHAHPREFAEHGCGRHPSAVLKRALLGLVREVCPWADVTLPPGLTTPTGVPVTGGKRRSNPEREARGKKLKYGAAGSLRSPCAGERGGSQ